jgi:hypothetical protein
VLRHACEYRGEAVGAPCSARARACLEAAAIGGTEASLNRSCYVSVEAPACDGGRCPTAYPLVVRLTDR